MIGRTEWTDTGTGDVVGLVLVGFLVLAAGGCVCVVWAERGGPRWVRAGAAVTLAVGGMLRGIEKGSRRNGNRIGGSGSGNDGND